jgi:class 3 adenylate cyclase
MLGEVILAVDDLPENLMTIKLGLRRYNYNLVTAKSGDRALEILDETRPEIILMDIQMPGRDGFQTAIEIKERPEYKDVPIIFLSALRDVENIVRCFESGGVDYISKPFRQQELIARIETHLKIRRLQRRLASEHDKMNTILGNVLPESYVNKLKTGQRPPSETFHDVVVFFTDFKNFTGISNDIGAEASIDNLNRIFFAFDEIVSHFGVERVKTIGDGYFAVAGINTPNKDAAIRSVCAMLKMQEFLRAYNHIDASIDWQLRVGAHIGTVIAGIVGYQKIAFDVWGSPVNTAARLQSVADTTGIVISDELMRRVASEVTLNRTETHTLHNMGNHQINFVTGLSEGCRKEILDDFNAFDVESLFGIYSRESDLLGKLFPKGFETIEETSAD